MSSLNHSCSACLDLEYDRFSDFELEDSSRYRIVSHNDMGATASMGCKMCSIVLEGLNRLWKDSSDFPEESVLLQKHPDRPLSVCKITASYWDDNEADEISDVRSWIELFTQKDQSDIGSYLHHKACAKAEQMKLLSIQRSQRLAK